jgi:hypothetical protein
MNKSLYLLHTRQHLVIESITVGSSASTGFRLHMAMPLRTKLPDIALSKRFKNTKHLRERCSQECDEGDVVFHFKLVVVVPHKVCEHAFVSRRPARLVGGSCTEWQSEHLLSGLNWEV